MAGLALITAPKAFDDARVAMIQQNALRSWRELGDIEIFLLGDEKGMVEAAREIDATHIPSVKKNERGTPLISSMLASARSLTRSELLCLINADMIMMRDLVDAAQTMHAKKRDFVLLGRRWDMEISALIDYSNGWEARLRADVRRRGRLHRPAGSDYFVFPRGEYTAMPDFAVGRAGWDNWMIYEARRTGLAVVDATPSITAIHQTHDYAHLPGGKPHHGLPETDENIRLAGGYGPIRYTILDATHIFERGELRRPPLSTPRLLRVLEVAVRRLFAFLPVGKLEAIARPKRWKRRMKHLLKNERRDQTGAERPSSAGKD